MLTNSLRIGSKVSVLLTPLPLYNGRLDSRIRVWWFWGTDRNSKLVIIVIIGRGIGFRSWLWFSRKVRLWIWSRGRRSRSRNCLGRSPEDFCSLFPGPTNGVESTILNNDIIEACLLYTSPSPRD